ncbi:MAG TPA: response regulator, partial [Terriglobales bacterium]|nr:response regulator [Terriglobales bacterium]
RDAMPDGGRLSIATYALPAAPRCGPEGDQACVRLTVSDTGTGMSAEVQSHIFEPFFTTKPAGRGTGLGLATVHGIVAQSGGRIEVISAPGQGSTFHVYLPAADAGESPRESPPPACGRGGNETILLVEDETSVRELAACVLREHGYRVIEAGNAERALEAAASLAGPLDLLLTDIVMPGLNGRELAERLGRDRAGLRVLFVSGYSDEALAHQDAACRSGAFLEKPFGPEALLGKVREVLEPSRPGPSGR